MEVPTFETRRLRLRSFVIEDALPLQRLLEVEGVLRYYPSSEPPDLERVVRLVNRQISHWKEHGFGWWAVENIRSQELFGWSGLQYLPETDEIEIGYLLSKPEWGKGLATEGARIGMQFGFDQLKIATIIGIVHPENIASQRVLEKLGLNFLEETEYFGMHCFKYAAKNPTT
jgi:ribosomal-protein-alanine N-acetyltransferase